MSKHQTKTEGLDHTQSYRGKEKLAFNRQKLQGLTSIYYGDPARINGNLSFEWSAKFF